MAMLLGSARMWVADADSAEVIVAPWDEKCVLVQFDRERLSLPSIDIAVGTQWIVAASVLTLLLGGVRTLRPLNFESRTYCTGCGKIGVDACTCRTLLSAKPSEDAESLWLYDNRR